MLEGYVLKGPDGALMEIDGIFIPDKAKIRNLARRLNRDARDRVKLGQWRIYIARGEGWRGRAPFEKEERFAF